MKSLNAHFYIKVESKGSQEALISIQPESFSMLGNLSQGHLSESKGVKEELSGIQLVLKGEKDLHSFGGDDWCLIDLRKNTSIITNGFEPIEIDTDHIVKLMEDWLQFLLDYENGNIPGIIHPKSQK